MTTGSLLDTNVLSEPLRPKPDDAIMRNLEQHQGHLATAAPVWHELVYGCNRMVPSKKRAAVERYLEEVVETRLTILPYDREAAAWHATERARLSVLGLTPPFVDGQIAAIAHVHGLVLVTSNPSDYAHFAELELEDWRTPAAPK